MDFNYFISKRLEGILPSVSMATSEKAKRLKEEGVDLIDLSIGEPDFPTPQHVKEAAWRALKDNQTHYTHSRGISPLREAIADKLKTDNALDVDPYMEVIVTPGAKQAVFYALMGILDAGDEVLVPEPFWLSYPYIVKLIQGVPVAVPSTEGNSFIPDIEALRERISPKTKAIILNNPANPTGALWEKEDLQQLAFLAQKYNLMVISDEIYEKIVFDRKKLISIGSLPSMKERTITINGFSKNYAMTGWRIAYMVGPSQIISRIVRIHQHTATCASSISQYGALAALRGPQDYVSFMVKEYQKRRDILFKGMKGLEQIFFSKPKGTFYAFLNVKRMRKSSVEVSNIFLEKVGIATVAGSAYGPSGEGYLRISFATSTKQLQRALERLKKHFMKGG